MAAKVDPTLIVEYVGIAVDATTKQPFLEAVRLQLDAYPERQEVLDGAPAS